MFLFLWDLINYYIIHNNGIMHVAALSLSVFLFAEHDYLNTVAYIIADLTTAFCPTCYLPTKYIHALLICRADHASLKLSSTCFMDVPSLSLIVIYYVPHVFILALLHALSAFFLYRLVSFPPYLLLPSY